MQNPFQRQEELHGWDQTIIGNLKCLVLGVGGLGSTISMDLCRLGVTKISLVDMDVVDCHNLNRQILYTSEHIGKSKVHSAKEQLNRHHNVKSPPTLIETYHMNALHNWQTIVKLINEHDIVFNTIDHGDYFDFVVFSMANKFNKIAILGGTEPFYGMTISYFLQGTRHEDQKYWGCHDLKMSTLEEAIDVDQLEYLDDISNLPSDSHPTIGGSTVFSAGICAHTMVCAVINYVLHLSNVDRPDPPKTTINNLMTFEMSRWFSTNITELMDKKQSYVPIIYYTGIGSNQNGEHSVKEFLEIMRANVYNFNEYPIGHEEFGLTEWIESSGAELKKKIL